MKKYDLTKSLLVALALTSTVVVAEDKYPASDFQPKVVYQDESATKPSASSPSSAPKASSTANDSQYPAANFEPKVLYKDDSYQHNSSVPSSSSSSQVSSGISNASPESAPTVAKEESSMGYILGLAVFAIAGFVLFKKGAVGASSSGNGGSPSVVRSAGGLTGVARYVLKTSGTGVSRYLEKQAKNSPVAANATGVAKYLANQVSSAKSTASQAVTGVEKYMRNKG